MQTILELVQAARVLQKAGRLDEAGQLFEDARARWSEDIVFLIGHGDYLRATGRIEEAIGAFRKAIGLAPKMPALYEHLSVLLLSLGRDGESEEALRQGLSENPGAPTLLRNIGSFLADTGRGREGLEFLMDAVSRDPRSANLRLDLGNLLVKLRMYPEAEAEFRKVLAARPGDPGVLNNIGGVLRHQSRLAEAEAAYLEGLRASPDDPDLNANLAGTLRLQGRIGDAKAYYERALALRSPWPMVHSNLIFCLDFDEDAGLADLAAARRLWQEAIEAPLLAAARPLDRRAHPDRKVLRIGYVSADFNMHSASDSFGAVLLQHDRRRFHVTLYSGSEIEDRRTAEFIAQADQFHRVHLLSDDDLAALIRRDSIDLLVDLSGHSAGNRLPVFARRPAPVQATGWGYATSTGMHAMDYMLADRWLIPWESRGFYTEEIVELPCFLSFRVPDDLPPVAPAPCLANGFVTFGSFNRLAKASDSCFRSWARLLHEVPGSRLLLKCPTLEDATTRRRILDLFRVAGIAEDRLVLRGRSPRDQQLAMHGEVDIGLDSFRHCGGITTCEALAMGVPVVSLCGDVPVARNGAALLAGLGCPEWIAGSVDDYVAKARDLAADTARLAAIRGGLRQLLLASPLGDNPGYAREVEGAYRRMWLRYCMGLGGSRHSALAGGA